MTYPPDATKLLASLRDGAWLDAQEFPPLTYAVPGLVPGHDPRTQRGERVIGLPLGPVRRRPRTVGSPGSPSSMPGARRANKDPTGDPWGRCNQPEVWVSGAQSLTAILRGFTASAFGNCSVSTPWSIFAVTLAVSIEGSSSKARR